MLKRVVVLSLILGVAHGSLFCPHTAEPSGKDNFRSMIIESKNREGQEPMYRIVDSNNRDPSFTTISEQFKLLTRMDNSECPGRSCVTELSAAMPRHQGSVLYLTNIVGKLIPPGFTPVEVKNRLYCTIVEGDCGATVPIYRHYKFTTAGLFHAYSTDGVDIDGFTRETMPLCWAWSVETAEVAGVKTVNEGDSNLTEEENKEPKMIRLDCSSKSKKPMRSAMKSLNVWKNNRPGTFMDHYYTTKHPGKGYEYDDTIGLVVVDEEKSKCNCLVRLTQMVDNKPEGLWARLDHKLVSDYKEPPPNAGEEYTSMEEEVYCAKEEGACGATIALRKFFKLGNLDTIYTVNDDKAPMFSVPSPSGVLCYIWPTGTADLPAEALKGVKKSDEDEKKETTTEAPKKSEKTPAKEEKPSKDSKQEKKPVKKGKKKDEKKIEAKKSEEKEKLTTAAPSSTTAEVTQTTTVKREEPSTTTVEVTSTTPSTTTEAATEATTNVEVTTEATTTAEATTEAVTTIEATTEAAAASESTTETATTEAATTSESTTSEIPSSSVESTVESTTEGSTTLTSEVKVKESTASSTVEPEKPVDEPKTSETPKEEKKEQTTTNAPESSSSTELPKENSTTPETTTVVEETTVSKQ